MAFAGRATGRLAGSVRGVDYLVLRADGRMDLNIHATIETDDGCRIALAADGVALSQPDSPEFCCGRMCVLRPRRKNMRG